MAEYRTIKNTFWVDPFIESLNCNCKLLYIYFFTCPHVDNLGVLEISRNKIAFETGLTLETVNESIQILEKSKKLEVFDNVFWLTNFIKNQCSTSPKILASLKKCLCKISNFQLKHSICIRYSDIFNCEDTLSIPYQNPTDTLSIPYGEREREREREEEYISCDLENQNHEQDAPKNSNSKYPNCPHDEIVELYHEKLASLPQVKSWSESRKRKLKSLWNFLFDEKKIESVESGIEFMKRYFEFVSESEFLLGRIQQNGRKPFIANLEWIITKNHFIDIIESKYHEH